ncbi:hypothetical protein HA466_0271450, partial [Hirschfeldia incana]
NTPKSQSNCYSPSLSLLRFHQKKKQKLCIIVQVCSIPKQDIQILKIAKLTFNCSSESRSRACAGSVARGSSSRNAYGRLSNHREGTGGDGPTNNVHAQQYQKQQESLTCVLRRPPQFGA